MLDACDGGLGPGVEFEEAVEEGGVATVADAVDVAGRFRGAGRVEGGEFGRVGAGRGEEGGDLGGRVSGRYAGCVADGGQFEAGQGRFAGGAFAVDVVEGGGRGAFHVGVEHAFEVVEVRVGGYVGDDVGFVCRRFRGLFPGVDRVEGEEGLRFVDPDEASVVVSVDHEPEVLFLWIVVHCVNKVLRPKDFGAAECEVGIEYTEDHVVLCQEKGVKICRSDGSAGESGKNGGFAGLGGYGEDSIDCLPTYFEIVIEPISCDWVCAGVRGGERSFEIWVEFWLAYGADWFKGFRINALERGVVGLEPKGVYLCRWTSI